MAFLRFPWSASIPGARMASCRCTCASGPSARAPPDPPRSAWEGVRSATTYSRGGPPRPPPGGGPVMGFPETAGWAPSRVQLASHTAARRASSAAHSAIQEDLPMHRARGRRRLHPDEWQGGRISGGITIKMFLEPVNYMGARDRLIQTGDSRRGSMACVARSRLRLVPSASPSTASAASAARWHAP